VLSRHPRLKLAIDAVASSLIGVSSPPSPDVALCRADNAAFEKYYEGVRSRPEIRFIPFAVTKFDALGGHTTAFLTELAKQAAASNGMHVGKLLVSWCRKASLAVHVTHAESVLRGLSAAADDVEAASSSAWMPSPATALVTRATGYKCLRASSRGA
jgi:hypothetical protein